MTPGSYLCKRREAAAVSIEALAAAVRTEPHRIPEHDRRAWLARIEADEVPITADVVEVYRSECEFDDDVLAQLVLLHAGLDPGPPESICRVCGCSWDDPCVDEHGEGCAWAEPDLCTACAGADVPTVRPLELTTAEQLPPAIGAAA